MYIFIVLNEKYEFVRKKKIYFLYIKYICIFYIKFFVEFLMYIVRYILVC